MIDCLLKQDPPPLFPLPALSAGGDSKPYFLLY